MALVHYTAEVKGGLLLELPVEAEELHLKTGDKVQVQLGQVTADTPAVRANDGMITVLQEIAKRHKGRRYTDGSGTNKMLREGRAGGMWGCEPIE